MQLSPLAAFLPGVRWRRRGESHEGFRCARRRRKNAPSAVCSDMLHFRWPDRHERSATERVADPTNGRPVTTQDVMGGPAGTAAWEGRCAGGPDRLGRMVGWCPRRFAWSGGDVIMGGSGALPEGDGLRKWNELLSYSRSRGARVGGRAASVSPRSGLIWTSPMRQLPCHTMHDSHLMDGCSCAGTHHLRDRRGHLR